MRVEATKPTTAIALAAILNPKTHPKQVQASQLYQLNKVSSLSRTHESLNARASPPQGCTLAIREALGRNGTTTSLSPQTATPVRIQAAHWPLPGVADCAGLSYIPG